MRHVQSIEAIHDAITTYDCNSYDEIAARAGISREEVALSLNWLRRPEVAEELGWTVPPVTRGHNPDRVYRAVHNDGEDLSMFADDEFKPGAVSQLKAMASMGEGGGHSLRMLANGHLTVAQARLMRRTAIAFEGAAAMARDMAEHLA